MSGIDDRMYSQTSGLNNYQPYADELDDFPTDGTSVYSTSGGGMHAGQMGGKPRNRSEELV